MGRSDDVQRAAETEAGHPECDCKRANTNRNEGIVTWIQLYDGTRWDLSDPDYQLLKIEHIAHGLARINRFSGHTMGGPGYSVAQHSVLVSWLVPDELRLPALLHDAHECLTGLGDISRPAKELMPLWVRWYLDDQEHKMDAAIAKSIGFDVNLFYRSEIKQADMQALAIERKCLMAEGPDWEIPGPSVAMEPIEPESPLVAEYLFLRRLYEVTKPPKKS